MPTVFIAGSLNIKHLAPAVKARLDNVVDRALDVVVGDADGADTAIQAYLFSKGWSNVRVYCSGPVPRNNVGNWPLCSVDAGATPGTRAFFTAKDLEMAKVAEYGLMIWDAKSTGTLSNVLELLHRKKKSVVFVNKDKMFRNVGDVKDLMLLLGSMSEHAKQKAEEKIRLSEKIAALSQEPMFS